MHWIIGIFMGFMALLGHQTAPIAVSTPVPAIIEAPKGVVDATVAQVVERGTNTPPSQVQVLPVATTTSFFNPNYNYMEPENIPAAEPVTEVETKPEYIAPAEETPGHVDGTEYSTKGY